MAMFNYPPKPWTDGQKTSLMKGLSFVYSASLKKWVPVTPGSADSSQLQQAFGVSTVEEVEQKINTVVTRVESINNIVTKLDSEIKLYGRIWKTEEKPYNPKDNDIWVDTATGKTFSFVKSVGVWMEN